MDLFSEIPGKETNLLPKDGIVNYHGKLFTRKEADFYFDALMNKIEWRNDEVIIFGKKIITRRKTAWYGEKPFAYTYSNITRHALPFTNELLGIKSLIEEQTGETFNSCLLNLYHNGAEAMGWHSDDEPELKRNGAIASVSFGAPRRFVFKHKRGDEKIEVMLEHGSLLLMKNETQTYWLHRLPPAKLISKARINLTFRTIA